MSSLLPTSPGYLAYWQLFVAATAVFNTIQNFVTVKLTRRVYNNVPENSVTPLQARTFGIWTLTSAMIRLYAAYHIHDKSIYDMAFFTYLLAFGHFSSEVFIFRTCKMGAGVAGPFVVATSTLIWMFSQYDFYVRS